MSVNKTASATSFLMGLALAFVVAIPAILYSGRVEATAACNKEGPSQLIEVRTEFHGVYNQYLVDPCGNRTFYRQVWHLVSGD